LEIFLDSYQTIFLIDGDNCHLSHDPSSIFLEKTHLYLYFMAKNNLQPIPFMYQQRYENCCVLISEAVGRDAVDHLISFSLGQLSVRAPDKQYRVVTHDHFGECLEKLGVNCRMICSI
jgi:hypothetical protein